MSSSLESDKGALATLGVRLGQLYQWGLRKQYAAIYDLCCDHAKLAYALWEKTQRKTYAIDSSLAIYRDLQKCYSSRLKESANFHILCGRAQEIAFERNSYIIIAGVGAYTCMSIIQSVLTQFVASPTTLAICCHQNIEVLREFLQTTELKVVDEGLIKESGQFYELLLLEKQGEGLTRINRNLLKSQLDRTASEYLQFKAEQAILKKKYQGEISPADWEYLAQYKRR